MTSTLVHTLDQAAIQIQSQISDLQSDLKTIGQLKNRGLKLHDGGKSIETTGAKSTKKKTVKKKPSKSKMTSMDMARLVLDSNGGRKGAEMNYREIRDAIKETYGVEPAISLDQMLYKRGKARKGFYRTPAGKYGRIEWTIPTAKVA